MRAKGYVPYPKPTDWIRVVEEELPDCTWRVDEDEFHDARSAAYPELEVSVHTVMGGNLSGPDGTRFADQPEELRALIRQSRATIDATHPRMEP